ncbi:O-antigen ligase family protein [Clostridium chrysemydis]|uniref:O-antigen ligase family protein n=1 Tax=Clostridium chrysemydis TaxID=2665504 RepID=UPI003F382D30
MGILGLKNSGERKELTVEQMINFFLYTLIYLLPFIYSPFGSESYYFPKAIFLWIISLIILILLLKDRKVKLDTITKVVIIFLVLIAISTIFSMDFTRSIVGGRRRYEGLLSFLSYGVLFIAAKNYLKITKRSINIMMILGAIMSIYGVFQFYGIDPVPRDYFHSTLMECYGFIGHRNFFSSYLLILLGISISVFIFYDVKNYLIYSLIFFAALVGTMTRGGWLSLAAVCFIGLFFILKRKNALKRAIIIVISFTCIFFAMNYFKDGEIKDRFETIKEDISDVTHSSGSGRVAIYEASTYIIKSKPLLGTGPSNFWEGIKEFAPSSGFWWNEQPNVIVDKAHNEYLNIAATTGIPSLIAYILLVILILKKVFENKDDDKFKVLVIVILGYLIQALFNISVVSVAPIFWVILGVSSNPKIIKEIK